MKGLLSRTAISLVPLVGLFGAFFLAKNHFIQNAKTQFENVKTHFENAKTQFENWKSPTYCKF